MQSNASIFKCRGKRKRTELNRGVSILKCNPYHQYFSNRSIYCSEIIISRTVHNKSHSTEVVADRFLIKVVSKIPASWCSRPMWSPPP